MALRHRRLTDPTDPRQVEYLNEMLRELILNVNQGGTVRSETPRKGENSPLYGTPSDGTQKALPTKLRAVPLIGGQRHKLQFYNGQEWEDI